MARRRPGRLHQARILHADLHIAAAQADAEQGVRAVNAVQHFHSTLGIQDACLVAGLLSAQESAQGRRAPSVPFVDTTVAAKADTRESPMSLLYMTCAGKLPQ